MVTLTFLYLLVVLAVATAGVALFVRALPWPKSWLDVKPLGCPACMSGWSGLAVLGVAHWAGMMTDLPPILYLMSWCAVLPFSAITFKFLYPPDVRIELP